MSIITGYYDGGASGSSAPLAAPIVYDFIQPFDDPVNQGWVNGPWANDPWAKKFTRHKGATATSGTGPTSGPTRGSYYLYAETSNLDSPDDIFALRFDQRAAQDGPLCAQGIASITFSYHLYGEHLSLTLGPPPGTSTVPLLPGATSTSAPTLTCVTTPYPHVCVRVRRFDRTLVSSGKRR